MGRLSKEEYQKLKDKYGELYSYSKYSTYLNDPYTYFLNYVLSTPKDRPQNNFNVLGEKTHDLIEKAYKDGWTNEQLLESFRCAVTDYQLLDRKFILGNDKVNDNVEEKYIPCVEHYLKNLVPLNYPFEIEEFVDTFIGNYYFYGYIDMSHKEADDEAHDYTVYITDFKTSTIYSGQDKAEHAEQLLLYAYAYSQKYFVPLNKIKIRWDFIKYVNLIFRQANGKTKIQAIERHELKDRLCEKVENWAKKLRYDEFEISDFLVLVEQEKYCDLPENIRNNFSVEHCYVEVDFTQKDINELIEKIVATIDDANKNTNKFYCELMENDSMFWREVTNSDEFYFNNLCEYSAKLHKPYAKYLDTKKGKNWFTK